MKKVFLCEFIHPDAYAYLKERVEIIDTWERFSEADAVIDRNFKIDEGLLSQTKQLKVIGVHGTGTDDVDLEAAKRNGIEVFSVPHQNAQSVAEMNVALMLALGRKVVLADRKILGTRDVSDEVGTNDADVVGTADIGGSKTNLFEELQGTEFHGKTVGLIGVGDISKRTARICRYGFGMKVIAWSRHLSGKINITDIDASDTELKELGIRLCPTMDEVFEKADVIMIGLALDDSTRGLVGKTQFAKMKKNAFLINSTRGAILDEYALYEALRDGLIGGAACDVFVCEPLTRLNKLTKFDNFIGTPHLGANTDEALRRVGMAVVTGVLERLGKES